MKIEARVQRPATLNARVKEINKEWIEEVSAKIGISMSEMIDQILDNLREDESLLDTKDVPKKKK